MTNYKFKLGVITINLNNKQGLLKTVDSILAQDNDNFLYVVIDGNSHDGSVTFLKTIHRDNYIFFSEKDTGIYNAMNKGLSYVKNCDYVIFLNSGDSFYSSSTVSDILQNCEKIGAELFYGNALKSKGGQEYLWKMPHSLYYSFLLNNSICHSSTIYKFNTLISIGAFNEKYKIVGDWKVLILFFVRLKKIQYIDKIISIYDMEGVSAVNRNENLSERNSVLRYYKYYIKLISIIRKISDAKF
jgi:glycosyltransferase involved in cell wall biosynthesis